MQITIDSKVLHEALGRCYTSRVLEAWEFALLQAEGNELSITSQDGVKQMTTRVPAEVRVAGEVALRPGVLRGVCSSLEGAVDLVATKVGESGAAVDLIQQVGKRKRKFDFEAVPGDIYPAMDVSKREPWSIDVDALREAINEAAYAADKNDPQIFKTVLAISAGSVHATNGHRLAMVPVNNDVCDVYLPHENIKALATFLATDDAVEAYVCRLGDDAPREIGFKAGANDLTLKLTQVRYPDPSRVLPSDETANYKCKVSRLSLLRAVDRVLVLRSSMDNIPFNFQPESESLLKVGTKGEVEDFVDCEQVTNNNLSPVSMNARYIKTALQAIPTEDVYLFAKSPHEAVWLRPSDSDSIHIIMPWRS